MKYFNTLFEIARGVIDLLGLYESSRFRRGLDEENRNLRECIQLERMRNLSMEGQVSMIYSQLSQFHDESREFMRTVIESGSGEPADEDDLLEEEDSLEERISNLEELLTKIPLDKLDEVAEKNSSKKCACSRGRKPVVERDLEKAPKNS